MSNWPVGSMLGVGTGVPVRGGLGCGGLVLPPGWGWTQPGDASGVAGGEVPPSAPLVLPAERMAGCASPLQMILVFPVLLVWLGADSANVRGGVGLDTTPCVPSAPSLLLPRSLLLLVPAVRA